MYMNFQRQYPFVDLCILLRAKWIFNDSADDRRHLNLSQRDSDLVREKPGVTAYPSSVPQDKKGRKGLSPTHVANLRDHYKSTTKTISSLTVTTRPVKTSETTQ